MRGGGPRYHYNSKFYKGSKSPVTYNVLLNNSLDARYRDDFLNVKKLTRLQLRIITGIEMFFGNFEELKLIYASREVPELAEYITAINEFNDVKNKMTSVVAAQGLKALNEQMDKAKRLAGDIQKAKSKVLEKLHILNEYKVTEEDIENMYSQSE